MPEPQALPHRAGLALGANLGEPARMMAHALGLIGQRGVAQVLALSSLWRTKPWGVADQPDFLNACALVATDLAPLDLLVALKGLETELGRAPGERWGPRLIDLDIIFHDGTRMMSDRLVLPHPQARERAFVLAPMAEVAPEASLGEETVGQALARTGAAGAERLPDPDFWPR